MATEERLRDELNRAADHVETDTAAALTRVVSTARRRQRVRRATLAVAAVAVIVVGAIGIARGDLVNLGQSPDPADRPSTPHGLSRPSDMHEAARTVLTGEWQTAAMPAGRVRAVLARWGASPALVHRVVGESQRWFVQMSFSQQEGTAALEVQTSDPTAPGSSLRLSDLYLYRLLPGDRLEVTPTHPGSRWVFSYRLEGDTLHLQFLRAGPGPPDQQMAARFVAWTLSPLTLVH